MKDSVEIRSAEAADYRQCANLLQLLQSTTASDPQLHDGGRGSPAFSISVFEQLLSGDRGRIIVAQETGLEVGRRLLGMATVSYNLALRYNGEYCQLEELIVHPDARGKNVGGLLIAQTVEEARARGCGEFGLYLLATTEHNRPF